MLIALHATDLAEKGSFNPELPIVETGSDLRHETCLSSAEAFFYYRRLSPPR
jgi:hypothetical protein